MLISGSMTRLSGLCLLGLGLFMNFWKAARGSVVAAEPVATVGLIFRFGIHFF